MIKDITFFKYIVSNSPTAVFVAEPIRAGGGIPSDFIVRYVNPSWEKMVGASAAQLQDIPFSTTPYGVSSMKWIEIAGRVYTDKADYQTTFYSDILHKWFSVKIVSASTAFVLAYFLDISSDKDKEVKLRDLNKQLAHMVYFDPLTQLPNRQRFSRLLDAGIRQSAKNRTMLALMFIDVDNLKDINDSRGHESGDQLIIMMADRLRMLEKKHIVPSRFGGDEFLLMIPNLETEGRMINIADTVVEILSEPYCINGRDLISSVSAGIALYPHDAENAEDLLKFADMAMHEVKRKGKNSAAFFHYIMQEKLLSRINLETKLSRAMDDFSFQLYFQPQYDIAAKTLRGFETLLRWHDAELGWISPDQFIPLAEESRIIIPLGDWVLENACRILKIWETDFNFDGILSVNVSPVQLKKASFIEDLKKIVVSTGIKARNLEIEITEGVLIENFDEAVRILQEVKDLGIGISLDDFGTGYASLSYLQKLPLTTLKIDKSFIANITKENSVECDITHAIISLVNKMGLDTIAEGVENEEQLSILKGIHCRNTQGFLMGKPMPQDLCERILEQQPEPEVLEAFMEYGTQYNVPCPPPQPFSSPSQLL